MAEIRAKGGMGERVCVQFRGRVQGVGFRHSTWTVARQFAVTGYVQNLVNGQVLLVAEGESAELDAFLKQVRATLSRHIEGEELTREPAHGEFTRFQIKF